MSAFTFPRCGMRSSNPAGAAQGYCGACHSFTGEQVPLCATLPPLDMGQARDLLDVLRAALLPSIYRGWAITEEGLVPTDPDRIARFAGLRDTLVGAMADAAPCGLHG